MPLLAQEAPAAGLSEDEITRRAFRRAGIDLDRARQQVLDEEAAKKREAERVEYEKQQREAERQKTLATARQLVESGNMVIKIDKERVEDISCPCPSCGASLDDARIITFDMADQVWRQAAGDLVRFAIERGCRLPLSVNSHTCPKCKTQHSVTIQVVI